MPMPPADPRQYEPTKVTHVSTVLPANGTANPHPANDRRNYFGIWNTGANIVYLRFGQPCKASATLANGDIPINAGNSWETGLAVPLDGVFLIAPNGATFVSTIEGLVVDPRLMKRKF